MARGLIRGVAALLGATIAWRVAAEVERERRDLGDVRDAVHRRAAVTVTRPDGSVDSIPVTETDKAAAEQRGAVEWVRASTQDHQSFPAPTRSRTVRALSWAFPLVAGLVGVAATGWALTHPLDDGALAAALAGLGMCVLGVLIGREDAAASGRFSSAPAGGAEAAASLRQRPK